MVWVHENEVTALIDCAGGHERQRHLELDETRCAALLTFTSEYRIHTFQKIQDGQTQAIKNATTDKDCRTLSILQQPDTYLSTLLGSMEKAANSFRTTSLHPLELTNDQLSKDLLQLYRSPGTILHFLNMARVLKEKRLLE